MTDRQGVERAITEVYRSQYAFVLAATVRAARDIDLAEECVQEAFAAAVSSWRRQGVPSNPAAWLTTVARRRVADAVRRAQSLRSKLPLLIDPDATGTDTAADETMSPADADTLPDERLRLIFMCCHPALAPEAQMALTLRLVCGLSTADIASVFLVSETTMAARITRAKKKITTARIPFRIPTTTELPVRLRSVLGVIHQLCTAGHTAPSGASLTRPALLDQSLRLARMVRSLMPDEPDVAGLLALLLVTDARRGTRIDDDGRLLRLEDQDRSGWDQAAIAEARELIAEGVRRRPAGRYLLQASIAVQYAAAPTYAATDWRQIVTLYDDLLRVWPSPVVALNRAVALSMLSGPEIGLAEVEAIERDHRLSGYRYLPAVKADLLRQLGRAEDAAAAYRAALELTVNDAERAFLSSRLEELSAR
jgi:RNA polymerase sigma-70 factor (ECF subfamily)